jgi:hypothetical protein
LVQGLDHVEYVGEPAEERGLNQPGLAFAEQLDELGAHAADGAQGTGGGVLDFGRRASHLTTTFDVRIRHCIAPFAPEINGPVLLAPPACARAQALGGLRSRTP